MTELIVILVLGLCGVAFFLGHRQGRASQQRSIDEKAKAASTAAKVRKDKSAARALLQIWFESGARPPDDDYRKLIDDLELETEPRQIRFSLHSIYEQNIIDVVVSDIAPSKLRPDKPSITVDVFEKFDDEIAWEIQFLDQEIRRISLNVQRGALTSRFYAWLELGKIDPHLRPDVLNRIQMAASLHELECIETRCRDFLAKAGTYDPRIDIFHGQFPPPDLPSLGDLAAGCLTPLQRKRNVALDGYLLFRTNDVRPRTHYGRLIDQIDKCVDEKEFIALDQDFELGVFDLTPAEWGGRR